MRALLAPVLGAIVFLGAPAFAEEPSPRLRAMERVNSLIEDGSLDEAEQLIEHLLARHPGDSDLVTLRETLRIWQGKLGVLLLEGDALATPARRADLRAACWRIVVATATGNPDEIRRLPDAGEASRLDEVLGILEKAEAVAPRTVALEIRAGLGDADAVAAVAHRVSRGDLEVLGRMPDALVRTHAPRILAALGAETPSAAACDLAGRLRLATTTKRLVALVKAGDPANRVAAAGALLAMGDPSARRILETVLSQGRPAEAVTALTALALHPGGGETARLDLLERVDSNPPVPRLRVTLVEVVLNSLEASDGPAAVRTLLGRLKQPESGEAAARALGRVGDASVVAALLAYLREPPTAASREGEAAAGGMGYLGRRMGGPEIARALALRSRLVAAIALLRVTRAR